MIGFTYNQLIAALQSWPVEDNDEYTTDLPRIVSLGELRLVKDLNLDIFDVVDSTVVVTTAIRTVPKPSGLIQTRALRLITSGVRSRLLLRSYDFCVSYAPDPTLKATPKYFAELSDVSWYLVPTPLLTGTLEAHFVKRPTGLGTSQQHTWLGDNTGDLLFFACLAEAENWLKADDRFADMIQQYNDKLNPARAELRNSIRHGSYSPFLPAAKEVGA